MATKDTGKQRRERVIDVLNKARAMELYAISQYMHQHYDLDDADYGALASGMKKVSIDEMRHAEMFAERIKDMDGEPTAKRDGELKHGLAVEKLYSFDANLESDTIDKYNDFLAVCRECQDGVSATLFEKIINEEQEHFNYFDDQNAHVTRLGNSYLAKCANTAPASND